MDLIRKVNTPVSMTCTQGDNADGWFVVLDSRVGTDWVNNLLSIIIGPQYVQRARLLCFVQTGQGT